MNQKGPTLSQSKGFAHILLMGLLLAGLIAGVYLVQQTQIFKPKASESIKTEADCLKEFPPRWEWDSEGYCYLKRGAVFRGRCFDDTIDYLSSKKVGGKAGCLGRNSYDTGIQSLGTADNCASVNDDCNDPIMYPNFPYGGYCYKDPNPDRGGPFYICTAKTEETYTQIGTDDNCVSVNDNCNDPILYPNFPNGGYCRTNPYPDEGGPLYECVVRTE